MCHNRCESYFFCGQKEKHREFREERKRFQTKIKTLRDEIASCKSEKEQAAAFAERNEASFIKVVKERLRKTDPAKYTLPSRLMKDLITLKTAYKGVIAPVSQCDRTEFPKNIAKVDKSVKSECFGVKSEPSDSDSGTEYKPSTPKRLCSDQKRTIPSHYQHRPHFVGTPPCMFMPVLPGPQGQFPMYGEPMQQAQQFGYGFAQLPFQQFQTNRVPMHQCTDKNTEETQKDSQKKKPKIWSPI